MQSIVVFDSGLGSLTFIRALINELPYESIVYFADRINHPYGRKSKEELGKIIHSNIQFISEEYKPKCIVVASITPSLLVLDKARSYSTVPLFGTYLYLDKAYLSSRNKSIALLVTSVLAKSMELDDILKGYTSRCILKVIDATDLVQYVESGRFLRYERGIVEEVCGEIKKDPSIDTILLGSTHLSFFEDYIREAAHSTVINPIVYNIDRIKCYLSNHDMLERGKNKKRGLTEVVVSSKDDGDVKGFISILTELGINIDSVKFRTVYR